MPQNADAHLSACVSGTAEVLSLNEWGALLPSHSTGPWSSARWSRRAVCKDVKWECGVCFDWNEQHCRSMLRSVPVCHLDVLLKNKTKQNMSLSWKNFLYKVSIWNFLDICRVSQEGLQVLQSSPGERCRGCWGEGRENPPPLHPVSNLGKNQHVDHPAQDSVCGPEKVLRVGHRQRHSGTSALQLKIALLLSSSAGLPGTEVRDVATDLRVHQPCCVPCINGNVDKHCPSHHIITSIAEKNQKPTKISQEAISNTMQLCSFWLSAVTGSFLSFFFFLQNYVFLFQAFRWCKTDFWGNILFYSQKIFQGSATSPPRLMFIPDSLCRWCELVSF